MIILVLWAWAASMPAFSAGSDADAHSVEYSLKAAFLYNFALFVEWPETSFPQKDTPIVIGIVGPDPFGSILDKVLSDKTAKGRHLQIRRLGIDTQVRECHMLFINTQGRKDMERLMELLKDQPILTVGESDAFLNRGGIIQMELENKRVELQINADLARKLRLSISSKLLSLAKVVR